MVVTINPLHMATDTFKPNSDEDFCEEASRALPLMLQKDGLSHDTVTRELMKYGSEVAYFDFESQDEEGPFLIYFQLNYDISQEGVVAVVIS